MGFFQKYLYNITFKKGCVNTFLKILYKILILCLILLNKGKTSVCVNHFCITNNCLQKAIFIFFCKKKISNFLFSLSLSSALKSLTSVFGMGTGVSSLLSLLIYIREIIL